MLNILRTRRSVRRFLPKPVGPETIQDLLHAAFCAPTAKNLRRTEFIVIQDKTTVTALANATPYAGFAKNAPLLIALCYNTAEARRFQEDCAMAAQNIYLEATAQGLGACYIQIADGSEAQAGPPEPFVKTLLNVPDTHRVLCLMAIGYPETAPAPHGDEALDPTRIHRERFGQS